MKISYSSVRKALSQIMPAAGEYTESSAMMSTILSGSSGFLFGRSGVAGAKAHGFLDAEGDLVSSGRDVTDEAILPEDRMGRYPLLEEMASYSTLASALNIHITHALSHDKKSGHAFSLEPVNNGNDADFKEAQQLCDELMNDIGELLNQEMPGWALVMCIFGVAYVRPYASEGVGITSFESSYYTLPHFIREYTLGGQLAGFTGDYIRDNTSKTTFADPWTLIPLRIPYWKPKSNIIPPYSGQGGYSLLQDPYSRMPVETQNYGTSMLEHSYEPYINLRAALKALKATRQNAAKIDRIIGLPMAGMDPAQGASYAHTISQTLKKHASLMAKRARGGNYDPTVINTLLPLMGNGDKGGMNIDTQSIPADITGIEDVMTYLKQLCSTVGLDYTLLGWADQMSGGLGEGGFLRTAIQAAMRAQWIRQAVQTFVYRAIDIHLAFKKGKVYQASERPYKLKFNSLNTAIQQEENDAADSRANYASVVTTIVDAISNNPVLSKSETFKQQIFGDVLGMSDDIAAKLVKEIGANTNPDQDDRQMMESFMRLPPDEQEAILVSVFSKE